MASSQKEFTKLNTTIATNNHIKKFILLLRKYVYSHKYIDESENFNKTSLPEKEEFYSILNMEDIREQITIMQRVLKDFKMKNLEKFIICILKVIHYF